MNTTTQLAPQQKAQITKLRREIGQLKTRLYSQPRTAITKESLFAGYPKGDFNWKGKPEEMGNVWCNDDWHESIQVISQGRENGKTWFVVLESRIAGRCDFQPVAGWDEREGDEVTQAILEDLWFRLEGRVIDHYVGWATYNLDVAVTGHDPLCNREYCKPLTPDLAIGAARGDVRYLRHMLNKTKRQTAQRIK